MVEKTPPMTSSGEPDLILSSAYFPPIDYFRAIASSHLPFVERCDSYIKQTYRSRCKIFATDGVLSLSIPVLKNPDSPLTRDVKIDYSRPWLQQHKRAIISAYGSSPFFEYYMDDIFSILDQKEESLFRLNTLLTEKIMEMVGLEKEIFFTSDYISEYGKETLDLRELIHPKKECPIQIFHKEKKPYYQVFSDKMGFKSNLSIIDLLFNEGPASISYLT